MIDFKNDLLFIFEDNVLINSEIEFNFNDIDDKYFNINSERDSDNNSDLNQNFINDSNMKTSENDEKKKNLRWYIKNKYIFMNIIFNIDDNNLDIEFNISL